MGDLSKNFSLSERFCKCRDCRISRNPYDVDRPSLIEALEQARSIFNAPFVINSWCRCAKHNEREGGVDSSAHVDGWAVDIRCGASLTRFNLINALLKSGFTRLGIASTFIHADLDPSKPSNVIWTY